MNRPKALKSRRVEKEERREGSGPGPKTHRRAPGIENRDHGGIREMKCHLPGPLRSIFFANDAGSFNELESVDCAHSSTVHPKLDEMIMFNWHL